MTIRRIASLLASAGLAHTALAQCPPSVPQNVHASNGGSCDHIFVSWDAVSGATSYIVYRNTIGNWGTSSNMGPVFTNSFTDPTASAGTPYYYWVVAKRSLCPINDTSGHSDPDTGWRNQAPDAPSDVMASDGTICSGVLVSWNQTTPTYGGVPAGYSIFRNTLNLYATSTLVGTASGTGGGYFLDTTAQVATTYYYWVRAENSCGTAVSGSDSGAVSVSPNPDNDLCGLAELVEPGTYIGSTACATNDGTATCAVAGSTSPDVWYAFHPPSDGTLHVDTCGASGSFNTVLSVRTGGCPGVEVACNDDACGTLSSLNVPVLQSIPIYRIRVAGHGSLDMGSFMLHVGFTPAAGSCYPNCDASTTAPVLNVLDFSCFLNKFAAGDPYANCDASTTPPVLNVLDFSCFLNKFAAGCS